MSVSNNVAELRRKRGIAAADLARRTGISRPTIYAIEAGKYVPNTAVALRMAHILETTVEDLFAIADEPPGKPATAAPELIPSPDFARGAPVRLCRVDHRLLAVASPVEAWQLPAGDAVLRSASSHARRATVTCFDGHAPADGLLIAGCDPAVSILARHLERGGVELVPARSNSSDALQLLRQHKVHIAGTHLPDQSRVQRLFPAGSIAVIAFAAWEEGLVVAPNNPRAIHTVADLSHPGLRLANREPGSACRMLFDAELRSAGIAAASIAGYDRVFPGHLPAAQQVKSGLADCCVATRSAALACGLDFIPLASRRYDLVLRAEHLALASIERMFNVLTTTRFRRELETLAGYDTRDTGCRVL